MCMLLSIWCTFCIHIYYHKLIEECKIVVIHGLIMTLWLFPSCLYAFIVNVHQFILLPSFNCCCVCMEFLFCLRSHANPLTPSNLYGPVCYQGYPAWCFEIPTLWWWKRWKTGGKNYVNWTRIWTTPVALESRDISQRDSGHALSNQRLTNNAS